MQPRLRHILVERIQAADIARYGGVDESPCCDVEQDQQLPNRVEEDLLMLDDSSSPGASLSKAARPIFETVVSASLLHRIPI